MSFLSGSPWQQSGIISGSGAYGQTSSGHQQQQQHRPNVLSGAAVPAVSASPPACARLGDRHCQSQVAPGGQAVNGAQGGANKTLTEEELKLWHGRAEGVPTLKIEDEEWRGGRQREDRPVVGGAGGSLGSAGQSPSSPLSSSSSPSVSPGKTPPTPASSPNPQTCNSSNPKSTCGSYIQGPPGSAHSRGPCHLTPAPGLGEDGTRNPNDAGSPGNIDDDRKSVTSGTTESLLGSQRPNWADGRAEDSAAAGLAGVRPGSDARSASANRAAAESRVETSTLGSCLPPNRSATGSCSLTEALHQVEEASVGSCGTLNEETRGQSSELPQRAGVRRAMSECSHLAVPVVMAGTYPAGMGGSPLMTPTAPNLTLMGSQSVGHARAPYPHVAVRRSLTGTDSTHAAVAMATMTSSPLMASPVLPSSPPPKRHHGSCETKFLLPVPPPAGTAINSIYDSKLSTVGEYFYEKSSNNPKRCRGDFTK